MTTPRGRHRRAPRGLTTAALLVVACLCAVTSVCAQLIEADRVEIGVVGGDLVAQQLAFSDDDDEPTQSHDAHTPATTTTTTITKKKKKTITIARATIATTRIAGGGVQRQQQAEPALPSSVGALEQCRVGSSEAQCASEPPRALPTTDEQDSDRRVDSPNAEQVELAQRLAVLDVAAAHLKDLQDHVDEWLPKLQHAVDTVANEASSAWAAVVSTWRAGYAKCVSFYDRFLADAVAALQVVYRRIADVTAELYGVAREWVGVVVVYAREVWEAHEEVRIVTRHVVSVVLLSLLGAVFFSAYALAATVPDTVSAMWTSLDELTRAQLKIVFVLVSAFTVYHLRALWSFWLLVGSIAAFYYWSGHVLAKTLPSQRNLLRQASQDSDKLKTN